MQSPRQGEMGKVICIVCPIRSGIYWSESNLRMAVAFWNWEGWKYKAFLWGRRWYLVYAVMVVVKQGECEWP